MPFWPETTEADHIIACARRHVSRVRCSGKLDVPIPKAKRQHPKRHGENRERSFLARRKAADMKAQQAAYSTMRKQYAAIMRAYYAGEIPDLSALATFPR